MPDAMLSFKLGPVQPFIEAARTLRDLWSGSYLLSWLTAHGMKPLIDAKATFITPDVDPTKNPLLRAALGLPKLGDGDPTLACLPHTFAAAVNWDDRATLCKAVEDAVRDEWKRIADAVRAALPPMMHSHFANWDKQVETYFEITVVVRPNRDAKTDSPDWADTEWKELAELLEMTRAVRHVPAYSPQGDEKGRFPVKCSQLGSLEQMGPADFEKAKEYWAGLTSKGNKAGQSWEGRHGTGLQSSDKLCAVALVKRFMWPFYLAKSAKRPRLDIDVRNLRLTDTATMAARKWLGEGEVMIDPKVEWQKSASGHWSGQWLHWTTPDQDDDAICPDPIWKRIQTKKHAQGKPPTYFALMHLDGDNMGGQFAGSRDDIIKATIQLTKFSAGVQQILKDHQGELIYAGGDDVLAFLPTETAIECARQLRAAFGKAFDKDATLSGGIAVVHYKEDLRFALGQVRAAEKAAKRIARQGGDPTVKDALALTICKRSGEHSTVVMGWPEAEKLQPLIAAFVANTSDRWAYKLREEVDRLTQPADRAKAAWDATPGILLALGRAETIRLVGRGEFGSEAKKKEFLAVIGDLFDAYHKEMQVRTNDVSKIARKWPDADVLTGFVALCQSASFLARGKE